MAEVFFSERIEEGLVKLNEEETHHIKVKRIKPEEEIIITDGRGRIGYGKLKGIKDGALILVERVEIEEKKENSLGLCVPLLKGKKMDEVIRTAVELGVDVIYPFISSRTVSRPKDAEKKAERWRKIVLSSSKVVRRFNFPDIQKIIDFHEVINLKNWNTKIILWEREKNLTLSHVAERLKEKVLVLMGPEGGFSDEEVQMALKNGFIPVSLGKRILRSSTVPFYVLSVISFLRGGI
jgi:16S rRNA (uracil1498-N3)-methyltransferase